MFAQLKKLVNFGGSTPQEDFAPDNDEMLFREELIQNFLSEQNVLIIQKEFRNISPLVKMLMFVGFRGKNIYATTDTAILDIYLKDKKPTYLFVESSLLSQKLAKSLEKNYYFKQVFLTSEENNLKTYTYEKQLNLFAYTAATILLRPLDENYLKELIIDHTDYYLSNSFFNDSEEMTIVSASS